MYMVISNRKEAVGRQKKLKSEIRKREKKERMEEAVKRCVWESKEWCIKELVRSGYVESELRKILSVEEKRGRGRPRKKKETKGERAGEWLIRSMMETEVSRCEIKGKEYLRSSEGVLYDVSTHEELGRWNEEKSCIEM